MGWRVCIRIMGKREQFRCFWFARCLGTSRELNPSFLHINDVPPCVSTNKTLADYRYATHWASIAWASVRFTTHTLSVRPEYDVALVFAGRARRECRATLCGILPVGPVG
jgi:hypothetical protein